MTVTLADLRTLDLFDDVEDADLEPSLAAAPEQEVEPGDVIANTTNRRPASCYSRAARTLLMLAHTQSGRQVSSDVGRSRSQY
jgi:hypothetical protein